jgi:hypothetical protein
MSITGYNPATVSALTSGTYRHVALTVSGSWHTLYLDGSAVAQNLSGGNIFAAYSNIANLYIGCAGDLSYGYTGLIDDFKIWNRALPPLDVSAVYWSNVVIKELIVPTTNLIHYYKFNEINGATSITDSVSATYNSTALNSCTFSTGKINNGIVFSSQSYVVVPNTTLNNMSSYSILFWIKLSAYNTVSGGAPCLIGKQTDGSYSYYITINQEWVAASGTNGILYFGTSGSNRSNISNTAIPLNTWTHVAISVNSNFPTVYINGIQDYTSASLNMGLTNNTGASTYLLFGATRIGGSYIWNANGISLDDLSIWDIALSGSRILSIYNSQK